MDEIAALQTKAAQPKVAKPSKAAKTASTAPAAGKKGVASRPKKEQAKASAA
jgi:hypothetical protein